MMMRETSCLLCGAYDGYKVLYKANFSKTDLTEDVFSARRLPDRIHYQIVRCLKDGMVRSHPVLPKEDAEQLYKRSKLNYSSEIDNLTRTYLDALQPVLGSLPLQAHILEIGCGNGFMLKALEAKGFHNISGVEPSEDAVKKADVQIRPRIICDAFRPALFPPASLDLIFFFQTLDHIHDPHEFIRGCRHLLKPGGSILSFQHNVESFSANVLGEKSPIMDIEHIYLFSPRTLSLFFEKNGFSVQKIHKPCNILSMRHLIWLFPIPSRLKERILKSSMALVRNILNMRLRINLGNLCLIAKKV